MSIPRFSAADTRHQRLAEISRQCHAAVATDPPPAREAIGRDRRRVREALRPQLQEIDAIVRDVLAGEGWAPPPV